MTILFFHPGMNKGEFFSLLRRRTGFLRLLVPAGLRRRIRGLGRFIPPPSAFPADDTYLVSRDHTTFRINRSDYVQWRLYYGVRDNALKEAQRYLQAGAIVLDIGANVGAFALRCARAAHRRKVNAVVHAFEPNVALRNRFLDNLALNPGLGELVALHPFGLGSEAGQRAFDIPAGNTGAGRVINTKGEPALQVDIRVLDEMKSLFEGRRVAFIKLIAGGFEGEIFRGSWRVIEQHRPVIFFEVTPRWYAQHGCSVEEIIRKLTTIRYTFMAEYKNDMVPFDQVFFSTVDQYYLLATPQ